MTDSPHQMEVERMREAGYRTGETTGSITKDRRYLFTLFKYTISMGDRLRRRVLGRNDKREEAEQVET